jgi:hypothetical protein
MKGMACHVDARHAAITPLEALVCRPARRLTASRRLGSREEGIMKVSAVLAGAVLLAVVVATSADAHLRTQGASRTIR